MAGTMALEKITIYANGATQFPCPDCNTSLIVHTRIQLCQRGCCTKDFWECAQCKRLFPKDDMEQYARGHMPLTKEVQSDLDWMLGR
jgi:uncharacterized protein with PIN domain